MAKAKDLLAKMDRTASAASPIVAPPPEPVAEPTAEPTAEPIAESVAEPAVEPVAALVEPAIERPAPPRRPHTIPDVPAAEAPRRRRDPQALPRRLPSPPNPSRFSLDLDRDVHKQLKTFATLEVEVDQSAVGRVLVELLLEDATLRVRVRERIEQLKRALV